MASLVTGTVDNPRPGETWTKKNPETEDDALDIVFIEGIEGDDVIYKSYLDNDDDGSSQTSIVEFLTLYSKVDDAIMNALDSNSEEEENSLSFEEAAKKQAEEDEARNYYFSDISDDEYTINFDLDALEEKSVIAKSTAVFLEKEKKMLENEKTRNTDDNNDEGKNTIDRSTPFDTYRKEKIKEAKRSFFKKIKDRKISYNFINLKKKKQFLHPKLNRKRIWSIFQITKKNMKLQLAKNTNIETWKTWRKSNNVEGWKKVLLSLLTDATPLEQEIIYKTLILFLVKDDPDEAIDYAAKLTNQEYINRYQYIYKNEYQKVYQRNTEALRNKYNAQYRLKKQKVKLQECMSNLKF